MKIHKVEQGSDAWHKLRLGKPTASRFDQIVSPNGKARDPKTAEIPKKYIASLVGEKLLGRTMADDVSSVKAVQWGNEYEPLARKLLAEKLGIEIRPGSFFTDNKERWGCSPDGLCRGGNEKGKGGVEIKCPYYPWKHLYHLIYGPEDKYMAQVQGQMWIAELDYVHFYSYHPEMPPRHIVTYRDETFISNLKEALPRFCDELDLQAEKARAQWETEK